MSALKAFIEQERRLVMGFMNRHANADFQHPGDVWYSRSYKCDCGYTTTRPEDIYTHTETHHENN